MMGLLEGLVQTSLSQALGYALVHFVWEGIAVAVVLAIALGVAKLSSARLRYVIACAALGTLPVVFAITVWRCIPGRSAPNPVPVAWTHVSPGAPMAGGSFAGRLQWEAALPWLGPLWMAGVLLVWVRVLAAWLLAQRMRRLGVRAAGAEWQQRLESVKQRMRMARPVILLESCLTEVPVVVGWLRPVVLMPIGLLAGFPGEQVEAFLIHELAHVRRWDYLVNLAQSVVEGLLFYHPAVWWISGKVRAEREHCCDDEVVALTGDAHGYAVALTTFEQRRWAAAEAVLAANGGPLMKRIHRLLKPGRQTPAVAPVAVLLLAGACVALAAWKPLPSKAIPLQIAAGQAKAPEETKRPTEAKAAQEAQTQDQLDRAMDQGLGKRQFQEQLNREVERVNRELEQLNQERIRLDELNIKEFNRRVARANALLAQAQAQSPLPPPASPYEKWLQEDVAYIITDEEKGAFQRLQTDEERQHFIEQFWERRDPTPGTPRNEFKEEHYRRIAYTVDNFGSTGVAGWKTDRGRIYIRYGPPDERRVYEKGGVSSEGKPMALAFEVWRYRFIPGAGNDVLMEFVDSTGTGNYQMTRDPAAH